MRRPSLLAAPIATPPQLSIPFDTKQLEQICPADRKPALAHLIQLLLEAANVAAEEHDDDKR